MSSIRPSYCLVYGRGTNGNVIMSFQYAARCGWLSRFAFITARASVAFDVWIYHRWSLSNYGSQVCLINVLHLGFNDRVEDPASLININWQLKRRISDLGSWDLMNSALSLLALLIPSRLVRKYVLAVRQHAYSITLCGWMYRANKKRATSISLVRWDLLISLSAFSYAFVWQRSNVL